MRPELSWAEAVRQGSRLLADGGIEAPRLTAEVLLAHAAGRDRTWLFAHGDERITELAWIHFGRWLNERLHGKPTQYITRKQEFFGREFLVGPGVLIPRPETEHVVEAALAIGSPPGPVMDVGTGSGCLAITLALEWRRPILAVDIGPLEIARENARRLGAEVCFWQGDLLTAVRTASMIVTNPPYLPEADHLPREVGDWEPARALFSGADGLHAWRRIVAQTPRGAWLIGEIDSRATMPPLFDASWSAVQVLPDLAGKPRVLVARRNAPDRAE